jgi:hypothetical protein
MKPKGLRETTILMCIFNLVYYAVIDYGSEKGVTEALVCTPIVIISFIVLWYYWLGKNWARILVMLTSIVVLINLLEFGKASLGKRVLLSGEAVLAVFLLYWLNTKRVVEYFKKRIPPEVTATKTTDAFSAGQ